MNDYRIYDTTVPKRWVDSIPIGNGRMGATLMCGVAKETLLLNEETVWSHNPEMHANPNMKDYLRQIKALFLQNKPVSANALANRLLKDCFPRICSYESAGKINVELHEGDSAACYEHRLDLINGIATVSYRKGGTRYEREYFASYPDNVIACRFTSSGAPLTACITYERERTLSCTANGQTLTATAKTLFGDHEFCVKAHVVSDGKILCEDGQILVSDTNRICVYIAIGTQFCHGEGYEEATVFPNELDYDQLRARHVADFSALMSRADVELPSIEGISALPLHEQFRLRTFNKPRDFSAFALQWQFGRYLLVSSSRKGTLPANLQGLWTDGLASGWSSDYHTNVNLQANYWGAEVANLSDCHMPLFHYMNNYLLEAGKKAAHDFYGTRGCVVHHLSDIYGFAAPADGPWGLWPHGASWLALHMWEHYLFTKDLDFLKNTAYTFLHETSVFFLENLERDVKGRLVYAPSTSPENPYYAEEDEKRVSCYLASGTTMDRQIISSLLEMYLKASELLGIEEEDTKTARKTLADLPPMQVGKHGQLMEWIEDYDDVHIGHRHTSHAFGLYPAAQITRATPELYDAMKVTLARRLSGRDNSFTGEIGWVDTWRSAMFSRLRDPASAYNMLNQFVSKTLRYNLWEVVDITSMGGNVFQIDGNLAYIASLAEMLLQSHEDAISLLPALPAQWDHGSFRGLCARGGYELDVCWENYEVVSFDIKAKFAGECRIELPCTQKSLDFVDESGTQYSAENGILTLNVKDHMCLRIVK